MRQLVDGVGAVTMTKSYEPYGEVLSTSGGAASRYGYTGEQMDETGLVYQRARMYSPVTGRFQSRDPLSAGVVKSLKQELKKSSKQESESPPA